MSRKMIERADRLWSRGRITPDELAVALERTHDGQKVGPEHKPFIDVVEAEFAERQRQFNGGSLEKLRAFLEAKDVGMADR